MLSHFIITGELVSLNEYVSAERSNKFIGAKIKKEQTEFCAWQAKKCKKFDCQVYLHFLWVTKNKRKDADNIFFACKFILDGMKDAGVVPDDRREYINSMSHECVVGDPKVVVFISDEPIIKPVVDLNINSYI